MNKNVTVKIKGGKRLSGSVQIAANKNAILPALTASLLTNEHMSYKNVPASPDVLKILDVLKKMGASVTHDTAHREVTICCNNLTPTAHTIAAADVQGMQAGYLFVAPLLVRFGQAVIPIAQGCKLGYRGYEDHVAYLGKLNVEATLLDETHLRFSVREPIKNNQVSVAGGALSKHRKVTYSNAFVTPTENVLMLLAESSSYTTEVSGIAQEPHVVQLLQLLKDMGAQIEGKGSTVIITGSDTLSGATFTTEPDHIDYFGFVCMAAMTKSKLFLELPITDGIKHMNEFIKEMGIGIEVQKDGVMVDGTNFTFSPTETFPKAGELEYKMNPNVWPGFPVDALPSFIALSAMNANPLTATRSTNWMYTDGLTYVSTLRQMGARVTVNDDQRVVMQGIQGGNPFMTEFPTSITAPDVIEGARAIISAALAGGEYEIRNAQYILRRNPRFFDILKELGADIEVVS